MGAQELCCLDAVGCTGRRYGGYSMAMSVECLLQRDFSYLFLLYFIYSP